MALLIFCTILYYSISMTPALIGTKLDGLASSCHAMCLSASITDPHSVQTVASVKVLCLFYMGSNRSWSLHQQPKRSGLLSNCYHSPPPPEETLSTHPDHHSHVPFLPLHIVLSVFRCAICRQTGTALSSPINKAIRAVSSITELELFPQSRGNQKKGECGRARESESECGGLLRFIHVPSSRPHPVGTSHSH